MLITGTSLLVGLYTLHNLIKIGIDPKKKVKPHNFSPESFL